MMGTRAKLPGDERDAFSRLSRRLLNWKRGELKRIKRRFWKRMRSTPVSKGQQGYLP
jgi:predicted CopG family antitoxin